MSGYMRAPGGGGLILNKEIVNITPTFDVTKGDILYSKGGQFSKLYLKWYDAQYIVIKSAPSGTATTAYKISYLDSTIELLFHLDDDLKDSSVRELAPSSISGSSFVTGKFGKGIKALATSDYIRYNTSGILNLASLTNFTIDWCEYHPNNNPTYGTIMQCSSDTNTTSGRYVFGQYYNSKYNLIVGEQTIDLGMFDVGAWTKYRVTKSGNIYKTWKNGVFIAQGTITTNSGFTGYYLIFLNATRMNVANSDLILDEVCISNIVRNTENFTPPTAPSSIYL